MRFLELLLLPTVITCSAASFVGRYSIVLWTHRHLYFEHFLFLPKRGESLGSHTSLQQIFTPLISKKHLSSIWSMSFLHSVGFHLEMLFVHQICWFTGKIDRRSELSHELSRISFFALPKKENVSASHKTSNSITRNDLKLSKNFFWLVYNLFLTFQQKLFWNLSKNSRIEKLEYEKNSH